MKPVLLLLIVLGMGRGFAAAATVAAAESALFDTQVALILSPHFLECHETVTRKGRLEFSRKSAACVVKPGSVVSTPTSSPARPAGAGTPKADGKAKKHFN